jgi:hypothetical protein
MLGRFNHTPTAATMHSLVTRYGLSFGTRSEDHLQLPSAPGPSLLYARPEAPR